MQLLKRWRVMYCVPLGTRNIHGIKIEWGHPAYSLKNFVNSRKINEKLDCPLRDHS